jgi:hypothetical protein
VSSVNIRGKFQRTNSSFLLSVANDTLLNKTLGNNANQQSNSKQQALEEISEQKQKLAAQTPS